MTPPLLRLVRKTADKIALERRERALRNQLAKRGLSLQKSSTRHPTPRDRGGYRVVDPDFGAVAVGACCDRTLADIEAWLAAEHRTRPTTVGPGPPSLAAVAVPVLNARPRARSAATTPPRPSRHAETGPRTLRAAGAGPHVGGVPEKERTP